MKQIKKFLDFKIKILLLIGLIVVIIGIVILCACKIINTDLGNLIVLAITAIFILFYVDDTHKIAKATEGELTKNMQPMIGFELSVEPRNSDFITQVHVTNNSRFFCCVWVSLNMRVYDEPIEISPQYDGEKPWAILPGFTVRGMGMSISDFLRKKERNLREVMDDSTISSGQKLTIDVIIKAKGLPGGEIEYPPLRWCLALSSQDVAWTYIGMK